MTTNRLEAFSDGVIAIIITIMVLELKVPRTADLTGLWAQYPVFLSYIISYVFIGIYWNNHHHLFHAVEKVDGRILWANLHLLFWLSIVPFVTEWVGGTHFGPTPVAVYGFVLLMSGVAFSLLVRALIARHGKDSTLAKAIGDDFKGWLSLLIYATAIPVAFVAPMISLAMYCTVACIWFVPDPRIEKHIRE